MALYLGIDLGTRSIKTLLYNADTQRVEASASAPLDLISGDDGARGLEIARRL